MYTNCLQCNKEIRTTLSKKKKGWDKYCSKRCYGDSKIGKKLSLITRNKISASRIGKNNPMWKGNKVGYSGIHDWVRARKKKPKLCVSCSKMEAIDLANISGKYYRDINDFEYLCRKCHMHKDGRIKNLKQFTNKEENSVQL